MSMQLSHNLAALPEVCYALDGEGAVIIIKRGESGFYPYADAGPHAQTIADRRNAALGVTRAQVLAMQAGSLFGFHVPGANPGAYEKEDAA